MTGVGGGDGVHGKTTSLVGGSGKGSLGVNVDGGGHLENIGLFSFIVDERRVHIKIIHMTIEV